MLAISVIFPKGTRPVDGPSHSITAGMLAACPLPQAVRR
jgi:hypothetical protein